MLMLVNRDFKVVKSCKNDEEFCNYICYLKNLENQKAGPDSGYSALAWEFMRCHHRFLRICLENIDQKGFREMAERSFERHQDMLIIYKGERESPSFVPAPSDFRVAQLKLDWVKSYANEHGLHVITV